jgi:hypothetical protein
LITALFFGTNMKINGRPVSPTEILGVALAKSAIEAMRRPYSLKRELTDYIRTLPASERKEMAQVLSQVAEDISGRAQ